MQQTFLFISEDWILPLCIGWIILGIIVVGFHWYRHGPNQETWINLGVFAAGAALIWFLLPQVMPVDPITKEVQGIPIRGYGFFLLLGVVSGVYLAIRRGKQLGLEPDQMMNLCFWLFVAGIVGARLFYVIQYRNEFESIAEMINMTQGGLVVYGSIFGGMIAAIVFLLWNRLPVLLMLDVLAPCMMIGLSLGRMGCLMNGCCWGGVCDTNLPAISFPEGSPPYVRQVETGEIFGMQATLSGAEKDRQVVSVKAESPAAKAGIEPGDVVLDFSYTPNPNDRKKPESISYFVQRKKAGTITSVDFSGEQIPWYSNPVHPTQIYSSINALFVFLFLWFYFPRRRHDGEVLALLLIIYPIGRFLLEFIRSDEMGQFGTGLTISQVASIGAIVGGFGLIAFGMQYLGRTEEFTGSKNSKIGQSD